MGNKCCKKAPVETPNTEIEAARKAKAEREQVKSTLQKENAVLEKDIKVLEKGIQEKKEAGFVREGSAAKRSGDITRSESPAAISPPAPPVGSPEATPSSPN